MKRLSLLLTLCLFLMGGLDVSLYAQKKGSGKPKTSQSAKSKSKKKTSKKSSAKSSKKSSTTAKASKSSKQKQKKEKGNKKFQVGADQSKAYLSLLKKKKVAFFGNQTSLVGSKRTVDFLREKKVNVTYIFAPEYGFKGIEKEGVSVPNSFDEKTKLPIISLYGSQNAPTDEQMKAFDVLVVDIQDVGVRFTSYYHTLYKLMNACAKYNKQIIILDRPNPNGHYVDGPLLDMAQHKSEFGFLPIPVVHGMTIGELAQMINGEKWLEGDKKLNLKVIPCKKYTHQMNYHCPVAPTPNLTNDVAIALYPSLCLFEATPVSLGKGTDKPFLCYGHPNMIGENYSHSFMPAYSRQAGRVCKGVDLSKITLEEAKKAGFHLNYLLDAYKNLNMDEFFFNSHFEELVGVDYVRKMLLENKTADEIKVMWFNDIIAFKAKRKAYLLYPE